MSKSEAWENNSDTPDITIEINDSTTTMDDDSSVTEPDEEQTKANMTIDEFLDETETIGAELGAEEDPDEMFTSLITRAAGDRAVSPISDCKDLYPSSAQTWENVNLGASNLPPPLLLQENLRYKNNKEFSDFYSQLNCRSLKLDLLSSIFQGLYPTEGDCEMVKHFISCPASLEVCKMLKSKF